MGEYEKTLKKYFGFEKFRENQLEIIKHVIEDKKDLCVIMFTGSGKSLCYQFPPVHTNKTALIISPLISLMNDQKMKLDELGIPCCSLNNTVQNKNTLKKEILENKYRLVYTTPEYIITQQSFVQALREKDILISLNLDEAHTISSYGNDFRVAYKQVTCLKDWVPHVPILALTATATLKVQKDIISILKLNEPKIIKTTFDRPNLVISVLPKSNSPMKDMLPYIKNNERTIIYCQTRNGTDELVYQLKKNNINADSYHAGMNTTNRELIHNKFLDKKITCVVATIAFGMGIDTCVRKVIHYGISKDIEGYYQEIGRAGRDGKPAYCYLFYALTDMASNNYFINQISNVAYRNHKIQLALIMKQYIFTSECRRKYILEYFGEKYDKDNCSACDNCLNKKNNVVNMHNFSHEASLLFHTMNLTFNSYGCTMIINVLRGSGSKKIPNGFTKSHLFGSGKNHSDKWWKILIVLLTNEGYIKEHPISGGHAFTLSITSKAKQFLESYIKDDSIKLMLKIPNDMSDVVDKKKPEKTSLLLSVNTNQVLSVNTNQDDDYTFVDMEHNNNNNKNNTTNDKIMKPNNDKIVKPDNDQYNENDEYSFVDIESNIKADNDDNDDKIFGLNLVKLIKQTNKDYIKLIEDNRLLKKK